MQTAAFRSALAVALFLAATLAFPQDGGFYLAAGTMATFAGPHDFQVGPKPADDADFTFNSKSTGSFDVGTRPRLPRCLRLQLLRLPPRG